MTQEVNRYNFLFRTDQASYAPANSTTGIPQTNSLIYNVGTPALTVAKPGNYYEAKILNVCMPFSLNMINATNNICYNNSFTITSGTYSWNMQMPIGNYTITSFCSMIQSLIQAEYAILNPLGTATFSVIQNPSYEGSVLISCTLGSESVLSLTLNFGYYAPAATANPSNHGNDYIGDMIGFPLPVTITPSSPQTGPNHFNVCPVTSIVLRSQALIGNNFEYIGPTTANGYGQQVQSNIIAVFNMNTSFDSYLNSTNTVPLVNRIRNNQINSIDFTFCVDDSLVPIDFRGLVGVIGLEIVEYEPISSFDESVLPITREEMKIRIENRLNANNTLTHLPIQSEEGRLYEFEQALFAGNATGPSSNLEIFNVEASSLGPTGLSTFTGFTESSEAPDANNPIEDADKSTEDIQSMIEHLEDALKELQSQ